MVPCSQPVMPLHAIPDSSQAICTAQHLVVGQVMQCMIWDRRASPKALGWDSSLQMRGASTAIVKSCVACPGTSTCIFAVMSRPCIVKILPGKLPRIDDQCGF